MFLTFQDDLGAVADIPTQICTFSDLIKLFFAAEERGAYRFCSGNVKEKGMY